MAFLASIAASAQQTTEVDRSSFVNVSIENDVVANVDDHYTNGLRASWLRPKDATAETLQGLLRLLPGIDNEFRFRTEHAVGQSIFTPRDLTANPPDARDRPYAGWLYYSLGVSAEKDYVLDQLQLTLGVVGPASFAEQTQKEFHRLIESAIPQGWDSQLKNEPGFVLTYFRTLRQRIPFGREAKTRVAGLELDLSPHVGAAIGNVLTYAAAGATVRFGSSLPVDYGVPRVEPSLPGAGFFEPHDRFGWYAFGGLSGRAVAQNIFLDGNTFATSATIEKRPFVGDLQVGIAVVWERFRLSYTHVFRTEEFYGQGIGSRFGSLALSYRF